VTCCERFSDPIILWRRAIISCTRFSFNQNTLYECEMGPRIGLHARVWDCAIRVRHRCAHAFRTKTRTCKGHGFGPTARRAVPPQAVALTKMHMDAFLLEDLCPRQSPLLPKITFTSAQQWPTKFAIERCQILPCCRSLFLLVDTRISFRGRWMAAATCASIGAERDFR